MNDMDLKKYLSEKKKLVDDSFEQYFKDASSSPRDRGISPTSGRT